MNKITLENTEWEIIEDYKEAYDAEAIKSRYTDYFEPYDYIIGDWSYGKLRLKGFCDKLNLICNRSNDFKFKDEYLKNLCNYECKYFILKKIKEQKNS